MITNRILLFLLIVSAVVTGSLVTVGITGTVLTAIAELLNHIALGLGEIAATGLKIALPVMVVTAIGLVVRMKE